MNNLLLTISYPEIYAIWDHNFFIYGINYKLSPFSIFYCFLNYHLVRIKKNYIKVNFSIE